MDRPPKSNGKQHEKSQRWMRVESKSSKVIITFLYEHSSGSCLRFPSTSVAASKPCDDDDLTLAISLRNCDDRVLGTKDSWFLFEKYL